MIDTRNFTTLISPWASISDFNLDRPTGSTWRPGDKNYWHRRSTEFFRPRFPRVARQFPPAGNFHLAMCTSATQIWLKFYKMSTGGRFVSRWPTVRDDSIRRLVRSTNCRANGNTVTRENIGIIVGTVYEHIMCYIVNIITRTVQSFIAMRVLIIFRSNLKIYNN